MLYLSISYVVYFKSWNREVGFKMKLIGIGLPATIYFLLCLHHTYASQCQLKDGEEQDTGREANEHNKHFDVIVLTQSWPVSVCKEWIIEQNGTECGFPDDKLRWTLHGIWPRKSNGDYVEFCNDSWVFDPKQIKSIEKELEQAWTLNCKGNPRYSFWAHEWLKHGTCSAVLKSFDSQFKYFNNGIKWNKKYSLKKMLSDAKLFPSDSRKFTTDQFIHAVKARTKKNPMIGCYLINGVKYLHELRICFDKKLNVIDCVPFDRITCPQGVPIIFPETP